MFNAVTRFAIYILGHKVDLERNMTLSRCHVLGHNFDLIIECDTVTFPDLGWEDELFAVFQKFSLSFLLFLKILSLRFGP